MIENKRKPIVTKSGQRFGFRKLSVGLAGVALGTFLALANPATSEVKADTVPNDPDQVNTQPSGEKAAQAELNAAKTATKTAAAATNTATTNQAAAKTAANSAAKTAPVVKTAAPKAQTQKAPTAPVKQSASQVGQARQTQTQAKAPAQTQTAQSVQTATKAAKPAAAAKTPAQMQAAQLAQKQPQTDQVPDDPDAVKQVPKIAKTSTKAKTNLTKAKLPQAARRTNFTDGLTDSAQLQGETSLPEQAALPDSINQDVITKANNVATYANEAPADDLEHNKYIKRTVKWVVKRGDQISNLTEIQQMARFGQLWEDSGNGKVYTPWESDPRKLKFDAYTNDDLLKYAKGTMSDAAYNNLVDMFKGGKYKISSNGAPASAEFGPLASDMTYTVTLEATEPVKNMAITVIYRDLDENNKVITSKGYVTQLSDSGSTLDVNKDNQAVLADLANKGYIPAEITGDDANKALPENGIINIPAAADAPDSFVYYVGLKHKIVEYQYGDKNPFTNKDDNANLQKQVTRTIKYKGMPASNPINDNIATKTFNRKGRTDMVTGYTTYTDWSPASNQFDDVSSPTIDGYTPDQQVVKGEKVTPDSSDQTIVVTYAPTDEMRDAVVHYRYDSWDSNKQVFPDKNRKIAATIEKDEDGNEHWKFDKDAFNQDIIAKEGYTATVVKTNVEGGKLHAYIVYVKDPANETVIHFIDQDNNNQPIKDVSSITSNNVIGKPIEKPASVDDILDKLDKLGYEVVKDPFKDPTNAVDGKQDLNYVLKHKKVAVNPTTNRTETVHFVDDQGNKLAPDQTQSGQFTHSGVTDMVTGETTWSGWSDNQATKPVKVPVVNGYVAETAEVPSQTLTPDKDIEITVKYHKIGKIIPVDNDGNPIPNAEQPSYENDPMDPTKVKPNQKVPTIPGYTPEKPTVTPTDPAKDTPVKYTPDNKPAPTPTPDTSLGIVVHDDDTNQDLNDYHWSSGSVTPGNKVDYDWASAKQKLIDHGYVVVQEPNIPDYYGQSAQVITIHVKHGQAHVNPDKPQTPGGKINKGNATWPAKDQYEHNRQYTVHFVDSKGRKLAPDQVQSMRFGRDLIVDTVTGKILNPDAKWTPFNDHYAGIQAAKINGYKVNSKSANGIALVNSVLPGPLAIDSDLSDSIVYTANDQVPNDPGNGGIDAGKPNNNLGGKPADSKNPVAPAKTPAAPTAEKLANKPAAKIAQQAKVQKASMLPQTGTANNNSTATALTLIGLALAVVALSSKVPVEEHRKDHK